jgi:hypothetical protein
MPSHTLQSRPRERDTLPEIGSRPQLILVCDVVRHTLHEVASGERMLRVPYDLFNPVGPVVLRGDSITYLQGIEMRTGRTSESQLSDAHAGERVLLRLDPVDPENDEWWLCEVRDRA